MKKNIHPAERVIRIIVGLLIASLAFWGPTNYWFLLGLIPVITGLVGSSLSDARLQHLPKAKTRRQLSTIGRVQDQKALLDQIHFG